MKTQLETEDLLKALTTFHDRYHAVDVFADNLSEHALADVAGGALQRNGHAYRFRVFPEHGVVRLERQDAVSESDPMRSAMLGAAVGGAVAAATRQRGEGILGGALLGLLVGGLLGTKGTNDPPTRRVFAMELDPHTREWTAYDGSLLRWMKSQLLPAESEVNGAA